MMSTDSSKEKIMSQPVLYKPILHSPREMTGTQQDLMPGQYGLAVQLLSLAAFTLAFVGWLNETWLFWFDNPIWLNRYTEYGIILGFGIWRIVAEKNRYTRKRLMILVFIVTVFWWMVPWLYPVSEPYVGFLWAQPVFPSLHVPGTITFFLILATVFLFGRRVICGFGCPCVGIRETVGFPFRKKTLRSQWTWRLRHSKWLFFSYYVGIMVVTQFPPNSWTVSFVGGFYLIVAFTYFSTFFLAPLVGNRFYCRYLCPYGATFGLLNHAGFYGIKMDKEKCNDCQRCEQVCDMGIPVWQQGKKSGRITALEDCMGCARCVVSCPNDALEIQDVRNLFKKAMVQNGSYLLNKGIGKAKTNGSKKIVKRQETEFRKPEERVNDWAEISVPNQWKTIQQQASRCLDCGHPGCINACPLSNKIPQWLEEVAAGNIPKAAEIAHSTSNLPEICGTLCPQHRLCEGSCTKARDLDGPVTIGAIERYLVNEALTKKQFRNLAKKKKVTQQANKINKQVAIIGSGPAGLACADELNKAGYQVTIFDRNSVVGGLLATGVPSFKLDKSYLQRRHQLLQQQGITFKLNFDVNGQTIKSLLAQYDALFLGTGAQASRHLKISGQILKGVSNAIDYLAQVNLSYETKSQEIKNQQTDLLINKEVIVLGGGDSAMDCARSAIRQQAKKVTIVYRGKAQAMRASPKELYAAKEEGVNFLFELSPHTILGESSVTAVVFNHSDSTHRVINCDQLILAIGQVNSLPDWLLSLNIKTDSKDRIMVNSSGRTSHPLIYAGGDNTNGPDLVVTAVAAGRKAAQGIMNDFKPINQLIKAVKNKRSNDTTVRL
ncbi:MAG: NAD(P)-binding protein [Gammaproteobacteria bacterium]|nr:NAD(P)-binding protein [Gammaproteobacteria bacterium]